MISDPIVTITSRGQTAQYWLATSNVGALTAVAKSTVDGRRTRTPRDVSSAASPSSSSLARAIISAGFGPVGNAPPPPRTVGRQPGSVGSKHAPSALPTTTSSRGSHSFHDETTGVRERSTWGVSIDPGSLVVMSYLLGPVRTR